MATAKLPADEYEDFQISDTVTLKGAVILWRNIVPKDRVRIADGIIEHAQAYGRLGYRVHHSIPGDKSSARLEVNFRQRQAVDESDIELLKGAIAATKIVCGWGGPGALALFFALRDLFLATGLA